MSLQALIPLTVAAPMLVGAILLAGAHVWPKLLPDIVAIATALAVGGLCGALALQALHGPLDYQFGGWTPRAGLALGIAFHVDPQSATVAAFAGLIVASAQVFAWGYFDEVHAHFHVLMLLFLAAMVGFCLTHDLFNLFVWFEVMSVAAYALTAYALETDSLAGALTFTVVNSLASFVMLAGVGLVYARAGQLDYVAVARVVAARPNDAVLLGGFALLAAALLTKAAAAPFHFWLSDAHAVAPSPVSVVFSGVMVSLGVFGLSKLAGEVFASSQVVGRAVHGLVAAMACLTAALGGVMAWRQRHLKRLLAFSTISHVGVMLMGAAALSAAGRGAVLVYLLGHGLTKGALFMSAGVLLATCASADEITLRGHGRGTPQLGVLMALGGLLLAGAPLGLLHDGSSLVHASSKSLDGAWPAAMEACAFASAVLTGAAVLRACGRIFLGWGEQPGEEIFAPTDNEREKRDRPLWLMLLAPAALLLIAVAPLATVAGLLHLTAVEAPAPSASGWLSVLGAIAIAGASLARRRAPWAGGVESLVLGTATRLVSRVHTGIVTDYVGWQVLGVAIVLTATLSIWP